MQNISQSFADNTHPQSNVDVSKLLQRAATGLSEALDLVLELRPEGLAVVDLERALGRGLRGVTALKLLRSMTRRSRAAAYMSGQVDESDRLGQQAAPLCTSLASQTPPMAGLKKRRPRRHFEKDYKRWVVQLRRERNLTTSQISKELNLTYSAVCSWVREFEAEQTASAQARTQQEERIGALEELVQQLREEKELLTKASALFARELVPVNTGR